ncbi:MAG: hypothetical protein ERJ68_08720 [Aphanocapsa feldmannii 277cI]|uniref:Uncharacterized protein n=1 Tax=Aphanocapsa feldmannii 277cI TaxID=2507554 RepID=A0A524RRR5_9CHRO|nr:MAG: hypothetical protein ERJ68_08720 [Aphanocapsa feldmannii 277cI]
MSALTVAGGAAVILAMAVLGVRRALRVPREGLGGPQPLRRAPSGVVTPRPFPMAQRLPWQAGGPHTAKELPQPQVWEALGLVKLKPPPIRAALKSS